MIQDKSVNAMIFREVEGDLELLLVRNMLESGFAPMKDREAAERFTRLPSEAAKLWVLDIDGTISGTLSAVPVKGKSGFWMLNNFTVAPYWRKGGLGRFMFDKCRESLLEAGCKVLVTMLHPELVAAEKLFLGELEFTAIREEGNKGIYLASLKL